MGDFRIAAFGLALILSACVPDASSSDASAPETAEAPDEFATTAEQASPWPSDYAAMRSAAAVFAQEHVASELEAQRTYGAQDYPGFDMFSCTEPDADPGGQPARETQLMFLAHQVVLLEQRLVAAGYQPDIWSEPLTRFQSEVLAMLDGDVPRYGDPGYSAFELQRGKLWSATAEELERRRQTLQPDSPAITNEGGCGAAETPFLVQADPPGGRVWLTTRFTFQTCEALGKAAWDTAACRWTEMPPDRQAYLSGNYMVQAQWPDGRTVRSTQRFQGDMADPESSEPVTVTIRPG